MNRIFRVLRSLTTQFWFRPAVMTVLAVVLAEVFIRTEEHYGAPTDLNFIYGGSPTGARTLLGAVASSMIGVAGTVFSITIAALSLASGQMGPRLLNNFTEDKGNQYTLGVFISTFAFSLYTLRAVQGGEGDSVAFVPHYGVTFAFVLAALCLGMLVYYIHHISRSINITAVTGLLRDDLRAVLDSYTTAPRMSGAGDGTERVLRDAPEQDPPSAPPEVFWAQAHAIHNSAQGGYLQQTDIDGLTRLLSETDSVLLLEVRPGDYVFPHMRVGRLLPGDHLGWEVPGEGDHRKQRDLSAALLSQLSLGQQRSKEADPEYAVRQLADIATRALSPGTNDPLTAVDVLDQFGDVLCRLKGRSFPSGVHYQDQGQEGDEQGHARTLRLVAGTTSFGGLTDQMFHMIRQYGKDAPAVMLRMLEVLTQTVRVLDRPDWRAELRRHAQLAHTDALSSTENSGDRRDIEERYREFLAAAQVPGEALTA